MWRTMVSEQKNNWVRTTESEQKNTGVRKKWHQQFSMSQKKGRVTGNLECGITAQWENCHTNAVHQNHWKKLMPENKQIRVLCCTLLPQFIWGNNKNESNSWELSVAFCCQNACGSNTGKETCRVHSSQLLWHQNSQQHTQNFWRSTFSFSWELSIASCCHISSGSNTGKEVQNGLTNRAARIMEEWHILWHSGMEVSNSLGNLYSSLPVLLLLLLDVHL